ncbi:MAG TPA: APC family permease [Myxococcota bacterium]|nr:APC family permease [Myxococcota bacterium]
MSTPAPVALAPSAPAAASVRRLGTFDVLAIGVNAIVGAGIFRLPGRLAALLGPASWLAFLVCGVLLLFVALCFAEASGMFGQTGGPYLYARSAFGRVPGFAVGWVCWVTMVVSWAAVASGIQSYAGYFVPRLAGGLPGRALVTALVAALALINYYGIRPGALTTNLFTVGKLVPLALFVAVGAFHIRTGNLTPLWPTTARAVGPAVLVALFPLQGFEVAPVPAGETRDPERAMPIAVLGSLVGAVFLYVAIQIVACGTLPGLAASEKPLADAAATFLGAGGAALVAAGGLVSMVGFSAGTALVSPRYLVALADDGWLPAPLRRLHPRYGSPVAAIAVTCGLALAGVWLLPFDRLVDFSNISVILQYVATCLAVAVLRVRRPDAPRTWRLPGGLAIPLLGLAVSLGLAAQATWREALWTAGVIVAGAVVALASRPFAVRP